MAHITISISGESYHSYATVAQADSYLVPDLNYFTWSALTDDQKGAHLIQATRFIDSLTYTEEADTEDERDDIEAFKFATILIASLVATGSTAILGATVPETQTKRLKAGSVETESFRAMSFYFPSAYSNWPQNIYALLRPYLNSLSTTSFGTASFGTCGSSPIEDYSILND